MDVNKNAFRVCKHLNDSGYEAWLVGGAVRDSIMGKEAHDWDIATNAKPEEVARLFPRVIETGVKHGTVTVMVDGEGFEVTTYRGEGTYSDGRRPDDVQFLNTIEEDLARRDFTINAIAYDPIKCVFRDPFLGRGDIDRCLIRAVGNPHKRFAEDGLRVLRAARFAATLRFEIELETYQAINPSLRSYTRVSAERIRDEWMKIMSAREPSVAFKIMAETGMLEITVPEMVPMFNCTQNKYHAYDVWVHTLQVVDACPENDPILRIGALFHDIGKPQSKKPHPVTGDATFYDHEDIGAEMVGAIASRLRFSAEERYRLIHLVQHHFIRYKSEDTDSTVRRWIRKVGFDNIPSLCTLARADIIGKGPLGFVSGLDTAIIDELEARVIKLSKTEVLPTSTKVLVVDGNDIMKNLGIPPGATVGKILAHLLDEVTDDPALNTREKLLDMAEVYNRCGFPSK
ncbi:MAG: CCA tRNA nucleotidyltransferase [Lentisphaeria bacterium]